MMINESALHFANQNELRQSIRSIHPKNLLTACLCPIQRFRTTHMMKKRANHPTISVEMLLQNYPPAVCALVEELRMIIRSTVPEATEAAHAVWRSINYRHPLQGYFCGLFPQANGVNLAFEFGALLPDPAGVLDGQGKQVRYLRCRLEQPVPIEALQPLIQAALELPPNKATKLALLRKF